MYYVSLPVHEKLNVVIDQLENFCTYSDFTVVVHVSKEGEFCTQELQDCIVSHKLDERVLVNPISVSTGWGRIIDAHLQNISFLEELGANLDDKVIFHSSNDMFVKLGVVDYVSNKSSLFHLRNCVSNQYWWPAEVAQKDKNLLEAVAGCGGVRLVGSQIEGSMYPLDVLIEIKEIIRRYQLTKSELFYPREEFYFSSFALALGLKPEATPYVYSEVHRFDAKIWNYWRFCDRFLPLNVGRLAKRAGNFLYFRSGFYKISKSDISNIRNHTISLPHIYEGNSIWRPYISAESLFAVKRVSRSYDDPIRAFIRSL